jgi:hypothetical protein
MAGPAGVRVGRVFVLEMGGLLELHDIYAINAA